MLRLRPTLVLACLVAGIVAEPASALGQQTARSDLVLDPLFVDDHQWEGLVTVDVQARATATSATPPTGTAPTAEATAQVSATASGGGGLRGSIDVDVVTAIVAERARQVGMRAIAESIREVAGGALGSRRYVQDLLDIIESILVSGTLQRTGVERLAAVLVRIALAEALLRTRFPETRLLANPSYWESRLCQRRSGTRQSAEALRWCRHLDLGLRAGELEATDVHVYLLDLAYWRLGSLGLFGDEDVQPPACPYALGEPGFPLCQVLITSVRGEERDAFVDWVVGLDRARDGLMMAHALADKWRPDGPGLRTFLRALTSSETLGSFGVTPGLRPQDWETIGGMVAVVRGLVVLAEIYESLPEPGTPLPTALTVKVELVRSDLVPRLCGDDQRTPWCADLRSWLDRLVAPPPAIAATPGPAAAPDPAAAPAPGGRSADGTRPGDRQPSPALRQRLQSLSRAIARIRVRAASATVGPDGVTATVDVAVDGNLATIQDTIEEARRDLIAAIWADGVGRQVDLEELDLDDLEEIRLRLASLSGAMELAKSVLDSIPRSVWDWRSMSEWAMAQQAFDALEACARLLELLSALNVHLARDARIGSIGRAVDGLRGLLGHGAERSVAASQLVALIEPVAGDLAVGRRMDLALLLRQLATIRPEQIAEALGAPLGAEDACEDVGSLPCWTVRIMQALDESTASTEVGLRVDGGVFRRTLAALGEDFKTRHQWRPYFHLTIGVGELVLFAPSPGDTMTGDGVRAVPIVAEQIGIGGASPAFFGNRLMFRFGAFASGILYRIVLDSAESDAIVVGGFLAVDIYELLEVYVAPQGLFFPGQGDGNVTEPRFGISAGVQVPLGDYLSRLGS